MSKQSPSVNWEEKHLSDICTVVSGGTPSRDISEYWNPPEVIWVTPTDITGDKQRVLTKSKEKISQKGLIGSSAKLLPINTILMTSRATLGEMKISSVECCTNQGFKSLIPNEEIDPWFLFYQMKRKKPEYERLGIGSTFLEVNKKDTDSFVVEIPDHRTQKNIAKILTTIDQLIEKTQELIDKHSVIKQGMMADLFTRGIDPITGQLRPPAEQEPHLYKETELGWIPKDWDAKPLSEYFSYISYGFTNPMPEVDDGPYMITAANIFDGNIQYDTARHTDQQAYDTLLTKKSRPKIGDLLLTKDGSLGRLAIVDSENICINQSVAVFRPNDLCDVSLLKFLLETERYQKKMLDDAGGSAIKHIYITIIDKMLLGLPKQKEEQAKLLNIITNIHETITNQKNLVKKLKLQKNGLMQDLLTGKVTIKYD